MVNLFKILNAKAPVIDTKVARLPEKVTLDQLFGVDSVKLTEADHYALINQWYEFFASLRNMGENTSLGLQLVFNAQAQAPRVASWFGQITSGMLSASDDPDDVSVVRSVLQTKSDTDYEFNWKHGGFRKNTVCFAPGDGVVGKNVIVDPTEANMDVAKLEADFAVAIMTADNVARPYGSTDTKLQFGEWRVTDAGVWKFWPSSVAVGSHILLQQELPMVDLV